MSVFLCMLVSQGRGAWDTRCLSLCSWLFISAWRRHPCVPLCFCLPCSADSKILAPVLLQGLPDLSHGSGPDGDAQKLRYSAAKQRVPELFEPSPLCFSCGFLCIWHLCLSACLHISLLPIPAPHHALCHPFPSHQGRRHLAKQQDPQGGVGGHIHASFRQCPCTTLQTPV